MLDHVKVEVIPEPVVIKGLPDGLAVVAINRLADDIAKKHKEIGILYQ